MKPPELNAYPTGDGYRSIDGGKVIEGEATDGPAIPTSEDFERLVLSILDGEDGGQ